MSKKLNHKLERFRVNGVERIKLYIDEIDGTEHRIKKLVSDMTASDHALELLYLKTDKENSLSDHDELIWSDKRHDQEKGLINYTNFKIPTVHGEYKVANETELNTILTLIFNKEHLLEKEVMELNKSIYDATTKEQVSAITDTRT